MVRICALQDLKKRVSNKHIFSEGDPTISNLKLTLHMQVQFSGINQNSQRNSLFPPLNLLVLLLSRQSLPIPPSPPFLSFVLISSKACDFLPQHIAFHAAEQLSSASARKTAQPQTPLRPAFTIRDPNEQAHKLVKTCWQY